MYGTTAQFGGASGEVFPPSAACKFLDLPPVNLRNLHLHLTKNPFASRPPHLCGVACACGWESSSSERFICSLISSALLLALLLAALAARAIMELPVMR